MLTLRAAVKKNGPACALHGIKESPSTRTTYSVKLTFKGVDKLTNFIMLVN